MRFIILFFLLVGFNLNAQIGLIGTYNQVKSPDWSPIFESSDNYTFSQDYHFPNTTGFAVDYWLRPLSYRIEILPRLSYMKWEDNNTNIALEKTVTFNTRLIELSLPIQFYLLDLEGDCDCPTWGKDGSIVKKGFFVSITPGLSFFEHTTSREELQLQETINAPQTVGNIGIGLGLDVGVAKFLTFTPFINYKRHFKTQWDALTPVLASESAMSDGISNLNQLQFGLRLGVHLKS